MSEYCFPYSKFTEYFLKSNCIDTSIRRDVESISAKELVCAKRFDIMAKLIYIDSYEKGLDMTYALRIYKDNINAFSSGICSELGSDSKNSFDGYVLEFNNLIESIKREGFDEQKSIIPVGKDNAICDGAHRVAIAAYYNKNVSIVRFPELTRNYDYSYFRRYLMCDINMECMAKEFAFLFQSKCKLVLWNASRKKKSNNIINILKNKADVVYEQLVFIKGNDIDKLKKVVGNTVFDTTSAKKSLKKGNVVNSALLFVSNIQTNTEVIQRQEVCTLGIDIYYETNSVDSLLELINILYKGYAREDISERNRYDINHEKDIPSKYRMATIISRNKKLIDRNMYGDGEKPYYLNWICSITKWHLLKNKLRLLKRKVKQFVS